MTISFRLRLFVTALMIVATVLAAVLLLGWQRVLGFEVGRLDGRLCAEARRVAQQEAQGRPPERLQRDLVQKLRLAGPQQLMLRQESSTGGSTEGDAELSAPLDWRPSTSDAGDRRGMRCALAWLDARGTRWRAVRVQTAAGVGLMAVDLAATEADLHEAVGRALLVVVPAAVLLSALGAWLLASLTMRPVDRLRQAMQAVSGRSLDQRVSSAGEDREFRELIDSYNAMLARLEAAFLQASRFSAHAAHELKTPLTVLQGRLEQALMRSDEPARQAELGAMLDEVGSLGAITRKLLLLSQADAGGMALHLERLDFSALLEELAADLPMLLQDQRLSCRIEPAVALDGDRLLLRQCLNNLLGNAVRHGLASGWIDLSVQSRPGAVEVRVANACAAIGAEERGRFFERFQRGADARARGDGGHGLGLSLAREIARAHGGDLVLEASPDTEVRLCLRLPLLPPRRAAATADPAR